ncbi:MAG TPA: class F sortase [Aeromicrobium sp.]|nr:class F sortase [Aeromicrobium sp.]
MHFQDRTRRALRVAIPVVPLLALGIIAALVLRPAAPAGPFQTAELTKVRIPGPCEGAATRPFVPKTADIQGIGKDLPVVPIGRAYADVPGVPPVSATHTVAFDAPGPRPGARSGLVRLNAHTWPNGAALGNEMLANFDVGDILMLRDGDTKLCYRITERVQVDGYATYERFYLLDVKPELAFIVCSGKRLGPGNWNKRTVWWGTPYLGDRRQHTVDEAR